LAEKNTELDKELKDEMKKVAELKFVRECNNKEIIKLEQANKNLI